MSSSPLALLSVTDKSGVVDFAAGLHALGYELLSTGGTARLLAEHGLPVTEVASYTGSPEILDGRVKTLHPKIHGGILCDRTKSSHREQAAEFGIRPIDLVVVNLYAFAEEAQAKELSPEKAIEFIDIGGPCMLRAAAKNYQHCAPLIDPADYERCLVELREAKQHGQSGLSLSFRQRLAAKTFLAISQYDSMIARYLAKGLAASDSTDAPILGASHTLTLELQQELRYGENPHQRAAFYRSPLSAPGGLQEAKVLQGKELSYNNLLDCDAAAGIAASFPEAVACTIIKHTNPCGTALARPGESLSELYRRVLALDPKSAFGGIVAFNREVDGPTALAMSELFLECIVAPSFSAEARAALQSKKNLRLLELPYLKSGASRSPRLDLRSVLGGILVQEHDAAETDPGRWEVVTRRKPDAGEAADLHFAMRLCKHVKSNAIVYAKDLVSVAVGAGQMSRVDAAIFAAEKAKEFGRSTEGSVLASDAFFPFRDTVDLAAKLGVKAIIQPGGSLRDAESIAAADEHGIAMVFTRLRHFRH